MGSAACWPTASSVGVIGTLPSSECLVRTQTSFGVLRRALVVRSSCGSSIFTQVLLMKLGEVIG
jgi:hypothetical protein